MSVNVIRINELPEGSENLSNDDIFVFMDDPSGNRVTKKISLSELKSFLGLSGGGGDVASVNGYTGVVVLSKIDLGLGNVDNTSDTNKPISTATQNALDLKAPTNNPIFTGSVGGLDKTMVGLNNVDNTSDANKPVSSATQDALNLKAPINNPTFTGTINGISKGMVGLGSVDNTSDIDKPVSSATQNALDNKSNLGHTHHIEEIDNLQNSLDSKQNAGSYAPVIDGKVPPTYLPSYVDDVLEFANFASFPNPGSSSVIYVDLSDNKIYRWGGTTYANINPALGTTDSLLEGSINLYFTNERASAASPVQSVSGKTGTIVLDKDDVGLSNVNNTSDANKPISTATQNALDLKAPINNPTFTGTVSGINKGMVGLGNVDNTSDTNKPVSSAQASAISDAQSAASSDATSKANAAQAYAIQRNNHTGTQLANTISDFNSAASASAPVQSVSGKTGTVTLNKNDVGLGNVDNTSDANKPISSATQAALNSKENTITSGTTGQYYRGDKTWQNLDKSSVGLGNVDNTSDLNKPISTAVQNALALKANNSDFAINSVMNGRLTLVSQDPLAYAFQNASSVLYYTQYNGNKVSLYNITTSNWELYSFTELSISLTGLPTDTNFDIFLYNNNGTLTLESTQWTNNTTRSIVLIKQDGVYVKSGSINKRYIGTIRTSAIGQTIDSSSRRFVWNYNNSITKRLFGTNGTEHTYSSTTTWRAANNNTTIGAGRVDAVFGVGSGWETQLMITGDIYGAVLGIAIDSVGQPIDWINSPDYLKATASFGLLSSINNPAVGGLAHGYHYFQAVELGTGLANTIYNWLMGVYHKC